MPVYSGTLTHLIPEHNCKLSTPMAISRPPFFVEMARQMLQALMYLHSQNILHRDVKPDNILYNINSSAYEMGDPHTFFLADFGLSKFQDFSRTRAGSMLYMAPEVINASETQTSKLDVWSLGVVFLQVLGCFCSAEVISLEGWSQTIQSFLKHETTFVISPMLAIDVANRYTAQECFNKFFNPTPSRPKSAPSQDTESSIKLKSEEQSDDLSISKKPSSQSPAAKETDDLPQRLRRLSRPKPAPLSRTPIRKFSRQSKTPDSLGYLRQRHTRNRPRDDGL
jgi:serine/threonine protein kinase